MIYLITITILLLIIIYVYMAKKPHNIMHNDETNKESVIPLDEYENASGTIKSMQMGTSMRTVHGTHFYTNNIAKTSGNNIYVHDNTICNKYLYAKNQHNTASTVITVNDKGIPFGVCELDSNAKVPINRLPNSVMTLEGEWDASTNTPYLYDGMTTYNAGAVFECTNAGTVDFGHGPITFEIGDYAVYGSNGIWYKSMTALSEYKLRNAIKSLTIDNNINDDDLLLYYKDETDILQTIKIQDLNTFPANILKEPTGFTNNENITVSYDTSTGIVTLSGTFEAYYKNKLVPFITDGWTSPSLFSYIPSPSGLWILYYDGNNVAWTNTYIEFDYLIIAAAVYSNNGTFLFALREVHGFMQHETHKLMHNAIGTMLVSGGNIGGYVLNSTTPANRRPNISMCYVADEDLISTLNTLDPQYGYELAYLTDTGIFTITQSTDIIPLSGNQPYCNVYSGGSWTQQLVDNNNYTCVWILALPTTNDLLSTRRRFLFLQGQQQGTLAQMQALTTQSLSLGEWLDISPEFVFIGKIIIQYTSGNWTIVQVDRIIGSKTLQVNYSQATIFSGVYSNNTLNGSGTVTNPLSVAEYLQTDKINATFDGCYTLIPINESIRTISRQAYQVIGWGIIGNNQNNGNCTITLDVKVNGTSIVGSGTKPFLSNATTNSGTTSNWQTTAINENDVISVDVVSNTDCTYVNLVLKLKKV